MKPNKGVKSKEKHGKQKLRKKASKGVAGKNQELKKGQGKMLAEYTVGEIANVVTKKAEASPNKKASSKLSKLQQLFGPSQEKKSIKLVSAVTVNKGDNKKGKTEIVAEKPGGEGEAESKVENRKRQLPQQPTKDDAAKTSRRKKRKENKLMLQREEGLRNADSTAEPPKKRKRPDDDGENEKVRKKTKKSKDHPKDPQKDKRTVFVGNLPISITKGELKKLFAKYGEIESVRLRSAAPSTLTLPKKVIMIQKDFHPSRSNLNGYVVFKDEQSAKKALKRNGKEVKGHHIRVDLSANSNKHDHKRSIFIGNLPFKVDDEVIRHHFEQCGKIEAIRLVRDGKTGIGKGFGYVLFADSSSVEFALKFNGKSLLGRQLRIKRSVKKEKKRNENPTGRFQKGKPKLSGASLRIQNKKNKKHFTPKK